jgi:CBS domain-containing protein
MAADQNPILRSTLAALGAHAPFGSLEPGVLRDLAGRLSLAYYAAGQAILGPQDGVADRLFIVKQGRVRGSPIESVASAADVSLGPGECFPVGALTGRRATVFAYTAERDTFCWELPAAEFHALLGRSARFREFCLDHLSTLVAHAHAAHRAEAVSSLQETAGMLAPLRSAISRAPVSCGPQFPVGEAIRAMHEARIGSIVIAGEDRIPAGIFTVPDVLERVTLSQAPMETPISHLMTPNPVCLEDESPLVEAALAMARHRIRHVVVTRDARLSGVISERDLFALQRSSLRRTTEAIHSAVDVAQLAQAAAGTRQLARHLLAHGVNAEHLTQMTSALNDALLQRLLGLAAAGRRLPARWCWLALGSEGRLEQTLATDQDNALLYLPDEAGDGGAEKKALMEFANEVNLGLAACGFDLCKGDIMARNPRWCLTLAEWRGIFDGWIRNPGPEALLNAAIFFDFRPVAGEAALAGELREAVLSQTAGNPAFGRAMAGNALRSRPPLGLLDGFVSDAPADFPGTIDLKAFGARPFVDAARILSLAHAIPATGTAARLRASGDAGVLPQDEAQACLSAFHYIQGLRLRRQYLERDVPRGAENRIEPDRLNAVDRRILKAAFRQAGLLQDRLRQDFGL